MSNSYQEKFNELESGSTAIKKKLEGGIKFKIKSDFQPSGDQPEAIKKIIKNLNSNKQEQVLLGVTGSGKTFTMAKVIESVNRPALVLAPNKTLAAQLYGEMKSFFQIMRLNILSHITTIIHQRPMFRGQTLILRRRHL